MTQAAAVRPKCVEEDLKLIKKEEPDAGPTPFVLKIQKVNGKFTSQTILSPSKAAKSVTPSASLSDELPLGSNSKELSPTETFMKLMKEWYKDLSIRDKSLLTHKKLINHAVVVAERLQLPWTRVPKNWEKILRKEVGIICYIKKSTYERRKKKLQEEAIAKANAATSKLVDLTNAPPPGWWLQAYNKGTAPPRSQAMFDDGEKVINYWDYNTKNWKGFNPHSQSGNMEELMMSGSGNENTSTSRVVLPHNGNGRDSLKNQILKQYNEDMKAAKALGVTYDFFVDERSEDFRLEKAKQKTQSQTSSFTFTSINKTLGKNTEVVSSEYDSDFD